MTYTDMTDEEYDALDEELVRKDIALSVNSAASV